MKHEKDIEKELSAMSQLTLNSSDKAFIKASLMSRAASTLPTKETLIVSSFNAWIWRGAISFASLVLVFVGTTYASKDSLPGEPLYLLKVNVLEEAISLSKIGPMEHTNYEIIRMENRLLELKALNTSTKEISPETLINLVSQINEHINDIDTTFSSASNEKISRREKISSLSKLSGIIKAQEKVTQNNIKFQAVNANITAAERETKNLLSQNISDFTKEELAESVNQYLSDEILKIQAQILTSTSTLEERESYMKNLYDLEEAILENDFIEAIDTLLNAEQEKAVARYLIEINEIKFED